MLKYIYKIIILLIVFITSILYFSKDVKEFVFNVNKITEMGNATLPIVTILTGDNEINILHGYTSNIDANLFREALVPISTDKNYEILINENEHNVKKINYEIREVFENKLLETNSISVFNNEDNRKSAKIHIDSELDENKEYVVKIILIASDSNKINYYHRVKVINQLYLNEQIEFVKEFNNKTFNKKEAENIIKYLEPKSYSDNTSLAYVNINSSFDLISWGKLKPKKVTETIPTIKECNNDIVSVELNYVIQANLEKKEEYYTVKEFYRIRYSMDRIFLLNFERKVESIFDYNLVSLAKNELKFGITSNYEVEFKTSDDKEKIAFVRNRELWYYDLNDNILYNLFSFYRENPDYIRTLYDKHNVKVLDINQEGNINFVVYGYMNRGHYEGKVGLILYKYYALDNRIEELLFIPADEPYDLLKENMGNCIHVSDKDVFYFNMNNKFYAYDLTTHQMQTLAENVYKIIISNNDKHIIWQEGNPWEATEIKVMDVFTQQKTSIFAPGDGKVVLYDLIDENFIYGYIKDKDIKKDIDGSVAAPAYQVNISSITGSLLKTYSKPGYFVQDISIKDNNIVELNRVKINGGKYEEAEPDYILNKVHEDKKVIDISTRVTNKALTEVYLTLPENFKMNHIPKYLAAKSTIITRETTQRVIKEEDTRKIYYPYIFDGIEGSYTNISEAIRVANDNVGVVLNNKRQTLWERGVKEPVRILEEPKDIDIFNENPSLNKIAGRGSDLDEILYFVYKGYPVIAILDNGKPMIIYGYDTFNIMIFDPDTKQKSKKGLQDSSKIFDEMGGRFIIYID